MNSWQFYQYTQYPDNLNLHDEVQLRGLIKNYPYFQAAHLLLAKCLKNQDNYSFEKQLKLAALYAPNRSLLYSLLKSANKPVMLEDIAFPVVEKTVEIPVSPEAEPIEIVEAEIKVELEIAAEEVDSIIETEPETVEQIETPQMADTIETPTEAETVEPELPDGVIYITETITPEITEEEKIIKDTVTEEPVTPEETMVADKVVEEPVAENQIAAEITIEELYIEPVIEETVAQPIAERAFSDWLKQTASNGGSVFMGNKAETTTLKQP